jgi:integrase
MRFGFRRQPLIRGFGQGDWTRYSLYQQMANPPPAEPRGSGLGGSRARRFTFIENNMAERAMRFMILTCSRASEVLNLRWRNLDRKGAQVWVRRPVDIQSPVSRDHGRYAEHLPGSAMRVRPGTIEAFVGRFTAAPNLALGTDVPASDAWLLRGRTLGRGRGLIERDIIGHAI